MTGPTVTVSPGAQAIRDANAAFGIHPTSASLVPGWNGERPDCGYMVDGIIANEHLADVPAGT